MSQEGLRKEGTGVRGRVQKQSKLENSVIKSIAFNDNF